MKKLLVFLDQNNVSEIHKLLETFVFGYLPGNFPYQLAPKIDIDRQFEMFILEPLNRIIIPSGMPRLNRSLAYTISLF